VNGDSSVDATGWRRFFQFHLSTAIIVMVVAAILLWFNLRKYEFRGNPVYGWPFPAAFFTRNGMLVYESDTLLLDILIAIGILVGIGLVSELVARRRAAHKK